MKKRMTVRTMDDRWKRNTKNGQKDRKEAYSDGKQLEGCSADLPGERVSESQCGNKGRGWCTGNTWQKEGAGGQKTTGWASVEDNSERKH